MTCALFDLLHVIKQYQAQSHQTYPNILLRRRWSRQRRRNAGPCLGTVLYEATLAKVAKASWDLKVFVLPVKVKGLVLSSGPGLDWRCRQESTTFFLLRFGALSYQSILGGDWRDSEIFTPEIKRWRFGGVKSFAQTDLSFTVFATDLVGVIEVMITAPPS